MPDAHLNQPLAPHQRRPPLITACLLLGLAGCSLQPPQRDGTYEVAVPLAWSGADPATNSGDGSLVEWWWRFDDPLLGKLVALSLQANTSVRSAQAALRQARALRDVAAAGLWPTLGSSATAQRSRSADQYGNSFHVGVDASWEVDLFGARRSALAAGDATAQASAAGLGSVQVSIAAEVALAYISLRSAQVRLTIAEANLASQQQTLEITRWRLKAGLVTSLEAEQARASAEQTRALLPPLRTTIAQSGHALSVLTGQAPAALTSFLAVAGPVPQVSQNLALAIPADTLRQRPDVHAAEQQIIAAQARVSQAQAARAPDFTLGGNLGLTALTMGSLSSGTSVVGGLLAGISLPLFDGGALRAQVRGQQAALEQAQAAYQASILAALQDVENALVALSNDRNRLVLLQNAADAAGNAALMARQRYGSGLVDFQVVLETQRSQLSTQDAVAGGYGDLSADHVRLYKALGGGWSAGASPPYLTDDITRNSQP